MTTSYKNETNLINPGQVSVNSLRRDQEHIEKTAISRNNSDIPPTVQSDGDALRQSFLLPTRNASINDTDMSRTALKANSSKFWDTTLGGYRAINPSPQYTRYADVKAKTSQTDSRGMGRYYSESQDANAQIIHMRFGTMEHNSLGSFLSNMYDSTAGKLARTGEGRGFIASIAGAASYVVSIPLRVLNFLYRTVVTVASDVPYNKFYYSKPAMPLYYSAVNTMLTKLAVNMKLIDGAVLEDGNQQVITDENGKKVVKSFQMKHGLDAEARASLHAMMPDIFNADTGFDIYAIATRHQRLANQRDARIAKVINEANSQEEADSAVERIYNTPLVDSGSAPEDILKYQAAFFGTGLSGANLDDKGSGERKGATGDDISEAMKAGADLAMDTVREVGEWFSTTAEFLDAEILGGSHWVNFKVESTGSISDSFSNSTAESDLANTINSASSSARATKFNLAGGNLGDNVVSDIVESATSAVSNVVGAVSESIGVSGFGALLGGGLVDIPKYWEDSTANLSAGDYTMKLRAVYGNRLSIFKDLYVPMCMLLGAALPLSTGTNTYTSPFLVELFDKGKLQTRLGMIENLNITRGTGNLGWSVDGLPTGIDISFSVNDLSTVMHMPIANESLSFNDHSKYQDFFASLGGLGALEQLTTSGRFNRKKLLLTTAFDQWTSPSNFANFAGDTSLGRLVGAFRKNTSILG